MKLLRWILITRWYFKNYISEQDDLDTLWGNIKLTRPNDIIRRDIGRMIVNESKNRLNNSY